MNTKLLLKTVFLLAVLFFLVLLGRENRSTVEFVLPPIIPEKITLPSAMMYYAFFAIGVITGTVMTAGGGGGGGGSKPSKSSK